MLDIACGHGFLLQLFKEAGIGATGVELDQNLCNEALSKGLELVRGDFFQFLRQAAPGSHDGAVASHIVEHFLPAQVEELFRLLEKALKPKSGVLVITPNIAHLRNAAGDFWRDPTHVRPYPVSALAQIPNRNGWEVVASGTTSKRPASMSRKVSYKLRNLFLGPYWLDEDVYVVARSPARP
ncbi:MAG TPA: class I SAM-dependent methyltransferase [Candidatus Paceibacterota bacterium]|nr:class I SAM-dependent methyltransferase [Verrucomicrobiota bacterium]HSA09916.1 class I SAM-dependent methyltransferase [Candidatus Paceibacterota bacterium]